MCLSNMTLVIHNGKFLNGINLYLMLFLSGITATCAKLARLLLQYSNDDHDRRIPSQYPPLLPRGAHRSSWSCVLALLLYLHPKNLEKPQHQNDSHAVYSQSLNKLSRVLILLHFVI